MLPELVTEIPGPRSRELAKRLRGAESRNVTYCDAGWPVFWKRAKGVNVWDEDGNRFLDFTSAFGVTGLGHGRKELLEAMASQAEDLLHGMGDVHPTARKVELCERLAELTFGRWTGTPGRVLLVNSGFEAVEAAMKTARLATGRRGIAAFEYGYHGLGYGALTATAYDKFRAPFSDQLADLLEPLPYPGEDDSLDALRKKLSDLEPKKIGAILVEPIQGRGGKIVPPLGFLSLLREWCDQHGALLIFDEIYTGFNRTGTLFACEEEGVWPDLICVGKALSGGFPISACVGSEAVMEAWPESRGEALHTSTFLGHPVGCAMSLAALELHDSDELRERIRDSGAYLAAGLRDLKLGPVRGRGLMIGLELSEGAPLAGLLKKGLLFLADGPDGNVLSFTPPFEIQHQEIDHALAMVARCFAEG